MQSDADYRTAYTMWAIGTAPLLIAVDVSNMTAIERSTLTNGAVAKMHLDPMGVVGRRVAVDTSCKSSLSPAELGGIAACQVWVSTPPPSPSPPLPLDDGSVGTVVQPIRT
jgi:alpha-galactosidase